MFQKSYGENQNTFYIEYLFEKNNDVCEIMWKNMIETDRPQMTVWYMHIACGILRLKTHTQNM
jgi:hypothetical protein